MVSGHPESIMRQAPPSRRMLQRSRKEKSDAFGVQRRKGYAVATVLRRDVLRRGVDRPIRVVDGQSDQTQIKSACFRVVARAQPRRSVAFSQHEWSLML